MSHHDNPHYDADRFPPPRPFQDTAHELLREGARRKHKNQVLMAPTGAGKTYLGMRVIHEALKKGHKAIFACDRTTLIEQTSTVADLYGLNAHGVLQASHWRTDSSMPFQIASVQTLARRTWPEADVIVIDECHTMYKAWTEHATKTDALVIGLSATPFAKGMGKLFTNLVNATTMDELVKSGVLVPFKAYACKKPDMAGAATFGGKNGEWTDEAAAERGIKIVGDVVGEWHDKAEGLKTIVFGANIAHCHELCRAFANSGVLAAVFTCETTPAERLELLEEYRKPDSAIRALISVEALAKGFDVPDVECVCDCRPLRKSLSTAIQMWGRGLRSHPGKTECVLLDFSGNLNRFKEDFEDIYFNGLAALDMGDKLDAVVRDDADEEEEAKACPECGFAPFAKRCMACGFEKPRTSKVQAAKGDLEEVIIGRHKAAHNHLDLWLQICTYVKGRGNPKTIKGRAWHLFKDIAKADIPRHYPDAISAPNVPISHGTMNAIRAKNIAFRKAIEKRGVAA
jgi:superfamily II DNA or RNA helicase